MIDDIDGRYHIAAYSSGLDLRRVLKADDLFVVASRTGNIRSRGRCDQGVYYKGTRHASVVLLRLDGQLPLLLSAGTQRDDLQLAFDLTNPDVYEARAGDDDGEAHHGALVLPYGTVHVSRTSFPHADAYYERIVITSFARRPLELVLTLDLDADFTDIFEVRGTPRKRHGERLPAEVRDATLRLGYRGRDAVVRRTSFELDPAPTRLTASQARFDLSLEHHREQVIHLRVVPEQEARHAARPLRFEEALARRQQAIRGQIVRQCQLRSSSSRLDAALERARSDLGMLLTRTPHGPYPYAGLPWYSTPFGRDGLWTALQTLWVAPHVAAGVLEFLSAHQATALDPEADAEPGKIIHEMRDGEMAALREVPFGRYYGSIDSTPLYLMLAWRYFETTADRDLIERLWPHLERAMTWVDVHGDRDGDGFVEYGRCSADGLVQQGWKDSNDSVFHHDGSLALGSIALCEVQGYVYDAKQGMARIARALGHEELAHRWQDEALALRERFDAAFWCEDLGTYALALDGEKRPCRVKSSNAAHCLYTGIALPQRRAALARTLMSEEMFSGYGIRTVATDELRYNPMSYHNGSIWPHDTGIAAAGLAATGFSREADRLLEAMLDVASTSELQRMPELFCGFPRREGQPPTQYPVACSPQAWAAGSIFMLLEAMLGVRIDALGRRITFSRPSLPSFIEELSVDGLRVGPDEVSIRLHRHAKDVGILVTSAPDDVEVVVIK
jgi:glycogen debranching enzyme